ncbi:MAG: tRNA 2-selenouridine(34) synthase MnmH [Pelagimonas sp.]|jgi:tRNA 2-selenouridine synthase|nr:tRNA 2-selenouridine(34) synthase MnmH [Pelagimonas sp.]
MFYAAQTLSEFFNHGFSTVIDVRSPAEFEEDRVPGAISLPVLDNEERARVGTLYKQQSPFDARKIGAALVFQNAARHIEGPLAAHDRDWKPLVYCWRGGQRSGSFGWLLREIGWRAEVVEGGYRSFRRLVNAALYTDPLPYKLVQLGGYTGTAKTEILHRLISQGVQVLDLEGLAHHRGSLLGALDGGQPSQRWFETTLVQQLFAFDPARPVLVEAESSKIGVLNLPPSLWEAMKQAPWIDISAPISARSQYLAQAYEDVLADGTRLRDRLSPLRMHRGHALVDHWEDLIASGDRLALCQSLAQDHYDKAYDKSMRAITRDVALRLVAEDLQGEDLDRLAVQIADHLQRMSI